MRSVLVSLVLTLRSSVRSRADLQLEMLALRQRLMNLYCIYYERSRTHLSLDKDTPIPRPVTKSSDGVIVSIPQVGGLHHRYERRAA